MQIEILLSMLIALFFVYIVIRKDDRTRYTPAQYHYHTTDAPLDKSYVIPLGEKAFIVGNEYVNLDPDQDLYKYRQQREDNEHYFAFYKFKTMFDRDKIWEEMLKTKNYIDDHPEDYEGITEEELEANKEAFAQYSKMAKILDEYPLKEREYAVKCKFPIYCASFKFWIYPRSSAYTLHHEPTAKYKGDYYNKLTAEFKEKNY